MDIFHQSFLRNYLIKDYEIFNNFVFSLKVVQPLMATLGVCELCSLLALFWKIHLNEKDSLSGTAIHRREKKLGRF